MYQEEDASDRDRVLVTACRAESTVSHLLLLFFFLWTAHGANMLFLLGGKLLCFCMSDVWQTLPENGARVVQRCHLQGEGQWQQSKRGTWTSHAIVEPHCFAAFVTGRRLFGFRSCECSFFAHVLILVKNEYSCNYSDVVIWPSR